MLFDTHAHYDSSRFDQDRHQLLSAMEENGVGRILNAGCDLPSSCAAIEPVSYTHLDVYKRQP